MIEIRALDPMGTQWSTTDTDALHVIDQKTGRCSWCGGTGHTVQGYRDCARCQGTGRIAETPTEPESPWIDPADRVPAIDTDVLIAHETTWGSRVTRVEYGLATWMVDRGSLGFYLDGELATNVIGWMPIPAHPKEKVTP